MLKGKLSEVNPPIVDEAIGLMTKRKKGAYIQYENKDPGMTLCAQTRLNLLF